MAWASRSPDSWTRSGTDLHLDLDFTKQPRQRLTEGIREAIRSGRLPVGSRLPSSRALAADLNLARGTVVEAYAQLAAGGWIASRPRSGTVVISGGQVSPSPRAQPTSPVGLDLRPGDCDLATFPPSFLTTAFRRALAHTPHSVFAYGDPRGAVDLRRELSDYLARTRGVRTDPEHLVITTGFTQSLHLTAQALAAIGSSRLAMEDPCLFLHRQVAATAGQQAVSIRVDADGIDIAALAECGDDLRAVLVTPARQFPLGVSLRPGRRVGLISWAQERSGFLIEDDYDGEFRYDRRPVGAIQGLKPAHVLYAGTTSKTLAPGFRLGWLAVPDELLDLVVEKKRLTDGQTSTLPQVVLADLLRTGAYDRHVRRMRRHYKHRRDALLRELAAHAPHVQIDGIAAGLSISVTLPEGLEEREVIRQADARGLQVHGMTTHGYYAEGAGAHPGALVINYAKPPEYAYSAAVAALVAILARQPRR